MSSLNSMNQSQMDDSMRDLVLQYCEAQANHDDELAQRILAEIEMINKREREILEGSPLKSHEGMIYGRMYAAWKKQHDIP